MSEDILPFKRKILNAFSHNDKNILTRVGPTLLACKQMFPNSNAGNIKRQNTDILPFKRKTLNAFSHNGKKKKKKG
jgi:hypothetical protein